MWFMNVEKSNGMAILCNVILTFIEGYWRVMESACMNCNILAIINKDDKGYGNICLSDVFCISRAVN